jgi:hypothetical protein
MDSETSSVNPIKQYYSQSKQRRRNEWRLNTELREYARNMNGHLVTTRFDNKTWEENVKYRERNPNYKCIYPTPEMNSADWVSDDILFVLEMNNSRNQIMGIGMVRNHVFVKKHRVYSDDNYNRYSYFGKYRIDRSEMSEDEQRIMQVFDILCFTGSRHMKRLRGIKAFPIDMLYRCSKILDLVDYIKNMFKTRLNA